MFLLFVPLLNLKAGLQSGETLQELRGDPREEKERSQETLPTGVVTRREGSCEWLEMSEGCKQLRLNLQLQADLQREYFHSNFSTFEFVLRNRMISAK